MPPMKGPKFPRNWWIGKTYWEIRGFPEQKITCRKKDEINPYSKNRA